MLTDFFKDLPTKMDNARIAHDAEGLKKLAIKAYSTRQAPLVTKQMSLAQEEHKEDCVIALAEIMAEKKRINDMSEQIDLALDHKNYEALLPILEFSLKAHWKRLVAEKITRSVIDEDKNILPAYAHAAIKSGNSDIVQDLMTYAVLHEKNSELKFLAEITLQAGKGQILKKEFELAKSKGLKGPAQTILAVAKKHSREELTTKNNSTKKPSHAQHAPC